MFILTFNDQQLNAIKKAIKWYFTESYNKQVFAIGGLAGTGKSTTVNTIIKMLGLSFNDVIFATLTAKASLVLRLKGNPSNTIHKTFYNVYKNGKSFGFSLRKKIPSNIKLIVLDEASMINEKMLEDIFSFGLPVILLLDPGQLPPIFGTNKYVNCPDKHLDVFLTEVMRQKDDSGILDLADMSRKGEFIELGQYKKSNVITLIEMEEIIDKFDVVLCYTNRMRRYLNSVIRDKRNYTSIYPEKNEKIVCLRNNYNYEIEKEDIPIHIINGLIGNVKSNSFLINHDGMDMVSMKFIPDFLKSKELYFDVECFKEIFEQYATNEPTKESFIEEFYDESIDSEVLNNITMIDYGYAITVHKSQGSSWPNVGVISDYKGPPDKFNKWLYTAITRAEQRVTVAFDR